MSEIVYLAGHSEAAGYSHEKWRSGPLAARIPLPWDTGSGSRSHPTTPGARIVSRTRGLLVSEELYSGYTDNRAISFIVFRGV